VCVCVVVNCLLQICDYALVCVRKRARQHVRTFQRERQRVDERVCECVYVCVCARV